MAMRCSRCGRLIPWVFSPGLCRVCETQDEVERIRRLRDVCRQELRPDPPAWATPYQAAVWERLHDAWRSGLTD